MSMNINNSNSTTTSHTQIAALHRAEFQRFRILGMTFYAKDKVGAVLINPKLPSGFESTSNDWRPPSHQKWWGLPFIETMSRNHRPGRSTVLGGRVLP